MFGLVSAEVEEHTHPSWWMAWWPVNATWMIILDVYVRPYAGAIGSISSLWMTTLYLIVPGWLRSSYSRRPSSVWTGRHAHLNSTRSSMFRTCYRCPFCEVQSNQRLSWNWAMPSLKSGTILRWLPSRDSLEAWYAVARLWLHHEDPTQANDSCCYWYLKCLGHVHDLE